MKYMTYPYGRREALIENYVIATYQVYGITPDAALDKLGNFAVGQTVGTWIKVPGITDEMVEKYQARVLELQLAQTEPEYMFLAKVAFPTANFGGSFAAMLTGLLGNDVSTSLEVRLVDLELVKEAAADLGYQPKKETPMEKLRRITGVEGRPLILNMIKPCVGFSPEVGAKFFRETALGGVDLIKDDELLTNPSYSQVEERILKYGQAAEEAYEQTGKRTLYIPNITDRPGKMREHAKAAIGAGAKACMVNFMFTGLDALAEICQEFGDELFILGHYAGIGVMSGEKSGIKNSVYLGTLPRIAGADGVITMFVNQGTGLAKMDYLENVQQQMCEIPGVAKTISAVGGGVNPRHIPRIMRELGNDVIIGVGGAIQGHPMGATQGAKAVMKAVEATQRGQSLEEAAAECEALKQALELWK